MPLIETCTIDAFRQNIRTEIDSGSKPNQAVAIARRVLEESCKKENKPMPMTMAKANGKGKSREYLEAALEQVRKLLPGWVFAMIHQAAFPSSGGRARRNRRISAAEKVWIEKRSVSSLSDTEVREILYKLNVAFAANLRQGKDVSPIVRRTKTVVLELKRRGLPYSGSAVDEAMKKGFIRAELRQDWTEIAKGFISGEPDGGMHAHGLDRINSKTLLDGGHIHIFVVPGSGEILLTEEDGAHAHVIGREGVRTPSDGVHSHRVVTPNGSSLETKLDGAHSHELMVETSGFGGLHNHVLVLSDGTEIESMSPAEFIARFVNLPTLPSLPIYSSREISDALNQKRELESDIFDQNSLASTDEVIAEFAKTGEMPEFPNTHWEVVELAKGGAWCTLLDMDEPILLKDANKIGVDVGDIVEVDNFGQIIKYAQSCEPHTLQDANEIASYNAIIGDAIDSVSFVGPQDAKIVFVSASPCPLEFARKEALAGPDGEIFQDRYLTPLGLTKSDVAVGFSIPVRCENPDDEQIDLWRDSLLKSLALYDRAKVVALGRVAKQALGPLAEFSLPHPAAIRRHGDRGEVSRKLKSIRKVLDNMQGNVDSESSYSSGPREGQSAATLADTISELRGSGSLRVAVTKSLPEKQIVYGVILDPYQVDLHNDWIPPAEIEATAHDFMTKSRVIGLRHTGKAQAEVVESWVEVYPTKEDRELALQNLAHKAYRRKFGDDLVHSGAWIAGVKLSDDLWESHKRGELDAFSIGGFSFKTKVSTDAMPEVEFVDLQPAS